MRRTSLLAVTLVTGLLIAGGIALAGPASADERSDRRDQRISAWRDYWEGAAKRRAERRKGAEPAQPAPESPSPSPRIEDDPSYLPPPVLPPPVEDDPAPPPPAEPPKPTSGTFKGDRADLSDGPFLNVTISVQDGKLASVVGRMNDEYTNQIGLANLQSLNMQAADLAQKPGGIDQLSIPIPPAGEYDYTKWDLDAQAMLDAYKASLRSAMKKADTILTPNPAL